MNTRTTVLLVVTMAVFIGFAPIEGKRYNGLIQRCGQDAVNFLKWICEDSSFKFPFPYEYLRILRLYRDPYKDTYPFQSAAMNCCRYGCPETTYLRMCRYHKRIQRCEKRERHHRTHHGRRKPKRICHISRN